MVITFLFFHGLFGSDSSPFFKLLDFLALFENPLEIGTIVEDFASDVL